MKSRPTILAGTAIGLLMASAHLNAAPLRGTLAYDLDTPVVLAQAECAEGESAEDCAARQPRPEPQQQPEPQAEPAPVEPAPKPAEEAAPEPEPQPAPVQENTPSPEPEQDAAPTEQSAPPEPEQNQEIQGEPAPSETPPAAETEQNTPPAAEQEAAPEPEQNQDMQVEPAPAETPRAAEPEQNTLPAAEEAAPAPAEQQPQPGENKAPTPEAKPAPSGEQAPAEVAPQDAPTPTPKTPQAPAEAVPQDAPAQAQPPGSGEQPVQGEAPADPNAAPILDSQKDAQRPRNVDKNGKRNRQEPANQNGEQAATPPPAADPGPPPADDRAAQQAIQPERIEPATQEKGKRRANAPDRRERERRDGVDVLKEIGDRIIIELGGRTMVESDDRSRVSRGARDVYYEDLPRGRTRETIERGNGDRIVTIRNRHGDIVQRSRITPDGREYVLNYVDERYYDDRSEWRDPGDDLPPMRLNIPRNRYILDSESVEDPDDYYEFLEQPPVERVQRLYSVQEVKRSARVRDIARRIDLDTLTFEFGSASISDSEVQKLEGVAVAMERLLARNPAETFLIEGHTDAVGTETANLALSDRRAEAVAQALTNAFGIPPENLSTQGYGEQYLKVNTSAPERQNRRVAIRRITPLVAPVASAQ